MLKIVIGITDMPEGRVDQHFYIEWVVVEGGIFSIQEDFRMSVRAAERVAIGNGILGREKGWMIR